MEETGIQTILAAEMEEGEFRQELEKMGLCPTYENAIVLQMVKKAAAGDLSAAKYVMDNVPREEERENCLEALPTAVLRRMLKGGGDGTKGN